MKTLFKIFLFVLVLCIIGLPIGLYFFCISPDPLVKTQKALSINDIGRARTILKENDPRVLKTGEVKSLEITEHELNILSQYIISRLPRGERVKSRILLGKGSARLSGTISLPRTPKRYYLNFILSLTSNANELGIDELRVGSLVFPGWVISPLVQFGSSKLTVLSDLKIDELKDVVSRIMFKENQLLLVYKWKPEVANKVKNKGRNLLLSEEDQQRLLIYNKHLVSLSPTLQGGRQSLTKPLNSLFLLAKRQSEISHDPVGENRAAIISLAFFVLNEPLSRFIDDKGGQKIPVPKAVKIYLRNRLDLAKHFVVSAAIAATADSAMADVVGLFKEVDDSKGGSGFSFADLTADRAGVRFGELATASSKKAAFVQDHMGGKITESNYMPIVDKLPEGLMELEFKRRYIDLESDKYKNLRIELENRINGCALFNGKGI